MRAEAAERKALAEKAQKKGPMVSSALFSRVYCDWPIFGGANGRGRQSGGGIKKSGKK